MTPGLRRATAVSAAALTLSAGACSSHRPDDLAGATEPAGPGMCAFMSKAELAEIVGPLGEVSDSDDPDVHDACSWRVRGDDERQIRSGNGMVVWNTDSSVDETVDLRVQASNPVTVRGHPGLLERTHVSTFVLVSTGRSTADRGLLTVSLFNGRDDTGRKVRRLADAAMRYVEAHR